MTDVRDPEVVAALEHAGLRARTIVDVTTIRLSGVRRATFRVDLESGATVKARRLEDEPTAARLVECRRGLPAAFVPALGYHGRVVLEEWIAGRIAGTTLPADLLIDAARLLATLHASDIPGSLGPRDESTSNWRVKTESWLRSVIADGALELQEGDQIRDRLERCDPKRAATGLCHLDFCGENMIVDESGQLRVIDNERVGLSPFGFDLARTWHRWELSTSDWQLFEHAYADAVPRDEPFAGLDFWRLVVLVQSTRLRLGTAPAHLAVPLDKLRRMAASGAQDQIAR